MELTATQMQGLMEAEKRLEERKAHTLVLVQVCAERGEFKDARKFLDSAEETHECLKLLSGG